MVSINPEIQRLIAEQVMASRETKEPSGRISAGKLGWPLQWMMLHILKVPPKPFDEYTLRKFQRGKDVEERIMNWLTPIKENMQVETSYRGVVGIADVILEYPIEVKSVTNAAFKYKQKEGPTRAHKLQGMLYAKALKFDTFGVAYIASDDYRVLCFEEEVTDEVDEVIDAIESMIARGTVPEFEPMEKWQADPKYNSYPDFRDLDAESIAKLLDSMGVVVPKGLSTKKK